MRLKFSCLAILFFVLTNSYADEMKGFLGLGYAPALQFDGPDPGMRQTGRLDFIRIPKNFGLELRGSTNSDYQDFGVIIKTFKVWNMNEMNATAFHLGLGLGANFGDKYLNTEQSRRERGTEAFLHGYGRYLWDFGNGVGLAFDLAYEFAPILILNSSSDTQSPGIQRMLLGIMLAVDVD